MMPYFNKLQRLYDIWNSHKIVFISIFIFIFVSDKHLLLNW